MFEMRKKSARLMWIIIFIGPAVGMFLLMYIWPLILAVFSSFTRWNGFTAMKFIGVANYVDLISDRNFTAAITNTLVWALLGTLVHVPWGVAIALILSRKPRGWRFTRSVYMLPNIISGAGMALLFIFIYKPDSGLLNSLLNLFGLHINKNWLLGPDTAFFAVTNMWLWYAAVITLITLAELLSIPPEIYESARIDGANEFQIDWFINLPLARRIIGAGVIITVTEAFKTFDIIYMTTNGGPDNKTLNLAVMMVNGVVRQNRFGYSNAVGIVLLAMGVAVMLLNTRIFSMDRGD